MGLSLQRNQRTVFAVDDKSSNSAVKMTILENVYQPQLRQHLPSVPRQTALMLHLEYLSWRNRHSLEGQGMLL